MSVCSSSEGNAPAGRKKRTKGRFLPLRFDYFCLFLIPLSISFDWTRCWVSNTKTRYTTTNHRHAEAHSSQTDRGEERSFRQRRCRHHHRRRSYPQRVSYTSSIKKNEMSRKNTATAKKHPTKPNQVLRRVQKKYAQH